MADNIVKELAKQKATINNLLAEQAKVEGRREQLLNQLQTSFNVSSLEEAEQLLNNLQQEIKLTQTELREIYERLDEIIKAAAEC